MASTEFEQAFREPAATFARPMDVLGKEGFSSIDKRRILERWRYQARSSSLTGDLAKVTEVEEALAELGDSSGEAPGYGIIGIFKDRAKLEKAVDELLSQSVNRANISLLTGKGEGDPESDQGQSDATEKPMGGDERSSVGRMAAGMPTYLAAVLGAGVTVASGGALAGVALAAVGGAVGGGLAGAGAARLFKEGVDDTYDRELASGGIVILIVPRDEQEAATVTETLTAYGAENIGHQALPEQTS